MHSCQITKTKQKLTSVQSFRTTVTTQQLMQRTVKSVLVETYNFQNISHRLSSYNTNTCRG